MQQAAPNCRQLTAGGRQSAPGRPERNCIQSARKALSAPFCAFCDSKNFFRSATFPGQKRHSFHQDRNDVHPFLPSFCAPADPPSAGPALPGLPIHQSFPVLHSFHSHQQRGCADAGGFCPSATPPKPDTLTAGPACSAWKRPVKTTKPPHFCRIQEAII